MKIKSAKEKLRRKCHFCEDLSVEIKEGGGSIFTYKIPHCQKHAEKAEKIIKKLMRG